MGAVVLTINTILLGGNIVFFQSLCLMGYCLFPMCIAAIVCVLVKIMVRARAGWGKGGRRGGAAGFVQPAPRCAQPPCKAVAGRGRLAEVHAA